MSNRATKQLSTDHQLILQALDILRQVCGRTARGEPVEHEDLGLLLQFFRQFVHEYHDAKEELILLPALVKAGQHLHDDLLMPIVSSHHVLHGLVADLESAFESGNNAEFVKLAEQYQKVLSDHIFTEDRVLFVAMSERLDDVSDHRVLTQFNEFEPGLRERSKAKFASLLRNRKYETPLCV